MAHSPRSPEGQPLSPKTSAHRPSISARSATAPGNMAVNGHFASVGQNGHADFSHGVQIIDEDKEFKCVFPIHGNWSVNTNSHTVPISTNIWPMKMSLALASITISCPYLARNPRESRPSSTPFSERVLMSCPNRKDGKRRKEYGCRRTSPRPAAWQTIFL